MRFEECCRYDLQVCWSYPKFVWWQLDGTRNGLAEGIDDEYRDYATIAIGLYAAAAGVPVERKF